MVAGETMHANKHKAAGLLGDCSAGSDCVGYDEATGKANKKAPNRGALGLCAMCIRAGMDAGTLVGGKNGLFRR
jgi:hypothetical protein